ncbi:GNAT family N-acetyltransferase [Paracoccus sp. (in: a-proteobacteria)]|uniref:GNAT family N-acetyltransferase n=1 Tax=Paracoccus sp. TaxID=267 RepID=UPI0026DFB804|nr:GNAT family N-acetyltransferase [Paracoccus sp. (in: a-proteobacteria)]MDO5370596.1 GNAT family N-acetyltransferase [Paracoccus sp. (in: a-proteobacteria)]
MIPPGFEASWTATWPAAEYAREGGFLVARGEGGGGRVSAARAVAAWTGDDIEAAEARHHAWGQPPLFAVGDRALAEALAGRGYRESDPTAILSASVAHLAEPPIPSVTAMECWPPLAIQRDLWAQTGIGPERQAIIGRAQGPKTAILGRTQDRAAGIAFVAVHGPVAMLHAMAVLPEWRGRDLGAWMVRRAARFAQGQGARDLALAVTRANAPALRLYHRMGFTETGGYAYWRRG